jgi:PAS domain S-box-containing protein
MTCESAGMAVAWCAFGSFRIMVLPLMLHFVLVYTGQASVWKKWKVHLLLYLPAVIFAVVDCIGLFTSYTAWNVAGRWVIGRHNILVAGLVSGWGGAICLLTLLAGIAPKWRIGKTGADNSRLAAGMLAILSFTGLAGWILDPLSGFAPGLFSVNGLVVIAVFSVLMYRYNLYSITPVINADDIIDAVPDALLITSVEGVVERLNPRAEQLTGYAIGGGMPLHVDRLFSEGFARHVYERAYDAERHVWTQESLLRPREGADIPVVVSVSLIRKTRKNIPVAMVISCHDSSFEKKALDEFRKTEQLEALGFLAGGIAHDFNNLLTSIVAYLSLARTTEDVSESMRQKLDKVDAAAHLVIDLNRQLAALSKGAKPKKEQCSLRDVLTSAIQLALSGSTIECRSSIPNDLHSVEGDATQLSQVFLNLLVNARQAMDHGGVIGVTCANITVNEIPWVEIVITDQGAGITAPNIDDIFKPFYTTKERGTGLGLSVVRSVVEKHGGTVSASTRKGVGSAFTVRLPCGSTDPAQSPRPRIETEGMVVPVTGRILVMDDEEGVRRAIMLLLTEKGHSVVTVEHGAAAIAAFLKHRSEGTPFDLLILDVTVRNGYGAQEVIRRVRELDPQVKAVVMSGYSENVFMKDPGAFGFAGVIPKPFDSREIFRIVNKTLGIGQHGT